jgi:hypothetical protein
MSRRNELHNLSCLGQWPAWWAVPFQPLPQSNGTPNSEFFSRGKHHDDAPSAPARVGWMLRAG